MAKSPHVCFEHDTKLTCDPISGLYAATNVMSRCGCMFESLLADGRVWLVVVRRDREVEAPDVSPAEAA